MARIGFLLISVFMIFSCKKNADNTIDVSGFVTDRINSLPIENVDVLLEVKDVGGTTFSNTFNQIETAKTNTNGAYEFSFQNRNALEYRFTFSKDGYFSDQTLMNPDLLFVDQVNTIDFDIYSSSYLLLNLKNNSPFNANDQVILTADLISSVVGSCFTNILTMTGATVDTTIQCQVYGNQMVKFDYFVTKDNFTYSYTDSVFCSAGDTLTKYIFY